MEIAVSGKCYIVEKDKLVHNIALLRQRAGVSRIYAVMKAGGYGIGCRELAVVCGENGLRCFAVTNLRDAETVKNAVAQVDELLLLSSADPLQIPRFVELGVTFTVASLEDACNLAPYGSRAHIKVDTGMGRRGFRAGDMAAIAALYARFPTIEFSGIYTHFYQGADRRKTHAQFARFCTVLSALEKAGIDPGICHCCNSAAMFNQRDMLLNGVRVGSAILGRVLEGERFGLQRTGICQVPVEAVRQLPKGSTVGYGGTFCTPRDMTVALCPIGTHNGLGLMSRNGVQSRREEFLEMMHMMRSHWKGLAVPTAIIHGNRCKALGCICSEAVMLDVTGVPCRAGDLAQFDINPMLLHDVPVHFI